MKTLTYTTNPTVRFSIPDFSNVSFPKVPLSSLNKVLPKKVTHTVSSFWTVFTYKE